MTMLINEINYSLNLTVPNSKVANINQIQFINNKKSIFSCNNVDCEELDISGDDFVIWENLLLVMNKSILNIYKINLNDIKMHVKWYKTINISCLNYYKFATNAIKKFFAKILLQLIYIPRYDAYLEGILIYLDAENIKSIEEYSNGIKITYKTKTVYYDQYFNIISDISELKALPNNLIQSDFMIKITKNNVLICREDTNFINKKNIKVKKYQICGNVLYILSGKKIVRMIFR